MRATQKFINEQFKTLLDKIKVVNHRVVPMITAHDPEDQYLLLRVIDRMDEDLFVAALRYATKKWMEELLFNSKMSGTEGDVYKLSGWTKENVQKVKDGVYDKFRITTIVEKVKDAKEPIAISGIAGLVLAIGYWLGKRK